MDKHTPGPWTVKTNIKKYYDQQTGVPYEIEDVWITTSESAGDSIALLSVRLSKEETSKVASLIAAAPEMLEALDDIANDSTAVSGLCERQVMMIRYAVQKARG